MTTEDALFWMMCAICGFVVLLGVIILAVLGWLIWQNNKEV